MDRKRAAAAPAVVAAKGTTIDVDADNTDSGASLNEEQARFVKDLQRFHDARG